MHVYISTPCIGETLHRKRAPRLPGGLQRLHKGDFPLGQGNPSIPAPGSRKTRAPPSQALVSVTTSATLFNLWGDTKIWCPEIALSNPLNTRIELCFVLFSTFA